MQRPRPSPLSATKRKEDFQHRTGVHEPYAWGLCILSNVSISRAQFDR